MKKINKVHIGLSFLLLGALINNQTFSWPISHNSFFADDFFDDFNQIMKNWQKRWKKHHKQMQKHFEKLRPSKEEYSVIKEARKKLAKIKPEIIKEDGSVIITFNVENIDKNNISKISIDEKQQVAFGAINTEYGKIEYTITPNSLLTIKHLEIKKEEKKEIEDKKTGVKDQKVDESKPKKDDTKLVSTYYWSDSSSTSKWLPATVDVTSADAVIQDNKLVIKLDTKKYKEVTPRYLQ